MEAPLTLFVWSRARIVPVRITECSITEEAFDTALNPIRAKVSLGLRVLSVDDLGFGNKGGGLFMSYLQRKEQLAARGAGGSLGQLGLTGIPMNSFAPNSRYAQTAVKTCTLPDGREVNYLARRFLPQPDELAQLGSYEVAGGDRLDTIAARVFGDPELFWRIVDGNRELLPRTLTDAIGRSLRVTLPAGIAGVFGA